MVRGEEHGLKINTFFRQPVMWAGFMLPIFFGSLKALHRYDAAFPVFCPEFVNTLSGQADLATDRQLCHSSAFRTSSMPISRPAFGSFIILSKFEKEFFARSPA